MRLQAAERLSQLHRVEDRLINTLQALLSDSPSAAVRYRAARALASLGAVDETVAAAVRWSLDNREYGDNIEAALILVGLGQIDEEVVRALVGMADRAPYRAQIEHLPFAVIRTLVSILMPDPWEVLAACHRLVQDKSISDEEGRRLADLTYQQPNDSAFERQARQLLFEWLWKTHYAEQ